MSRARATTAAWRLIVLALYVCAAALLSGQNPPSRTKTTAVVDEARRVAALESIGSRVLLPSTVPALFGMTRVEAARMLEPLHLRPAFSGVETGIVVDQKPTAGTTVRYGSEVALGLGGMPRLFLNGPLAPAYAGSELTFNASLVPPLPAGTQVIYYFLWGDGSRAEGTANGVVTHRFADATRHLVSVVAVINNNRVKIEGRVSVDVLAVPPPADTVQTATVVATSATTATVATEAPPASPTTATTASSATTTTATTAPETTTEPPITARTTTGTPFVPKPDPSSNLLVIIAAAAVVLLLVVTFLLARVLRALNRKPSEPQMQAKSPVAFNGGVRAIEYEIEHPELIRRGPSVGLRGGIRAEEGGNV